MGVALSHGYMPGCAGAALSHGYTPGCVSVALSHGYVPGCALCRALATRLAAQYDNEPIIIVKANITE